jgi:HSP20 family protein
LQFFAIFFAGSSHRYYVSTVIDRVLSLTIKKRQFWAQKHDPGGNMLGSNTIWNDLAEVQNEFDRLFRWSFGDGVSSYYPPVNIAENDDAYTVQARVPGLTKDDITIELEGRQLTISGEHKRVEANYVREERANGRFERAFTFRHDLQADKVEATVKDGILTVTLPKAEEAKPRRIEIVSK